MYGMHGAKLNMSLTNHVIFAKLVPSCYLLSITAIAIIFLCNNNFNTLTQCE